MRPQIDHLPDFYPFTQPKLSYLSQNRYAPVHVPQVRVTYNSCQADLDEMPAEALEALESEEKQLVEENKVVGGKVKALTQGQSFGIVYMGVKVTELYVLELAHLRNAPTNEELSEMLCEAEQTVYHKLSSSIDVVSPDSPAANHSSQSTTTSSCWSITLELGRFSIPGFRMAKVEGIVGGEEKGVSHVGSISTS